MYIQTKEVQRAKWGERHLFLQSIPGVVVCHHYFQLFCHLTGVLPLFKGSFDCQDLINSGIILASGVNYQGKRVQDRVSVPTVTSMS